MQTCTCTGKWSILSPVGDINTTLLNLIMLILFQGDITA